MNVAAWMLLYAATLTWLGPPRFWAASPAVAAAPPGWVSPSG